MPETQAPPARPWAQRLGDLRQRRHIVALALILVLCVGVFAFGASAWLADAADYSQRKIVNDDYATLTAPLAAGGEIRQNLYTKERIFGIVLDVTTYNRVARGTLHLRLEDEDGNTVAACDTDMTELLDNTFHRFIFDREVPAPAEDRAKYTLVITASGEAPEDVLGFHRSDGPAQNFVAEGRNSPEYNLKHFTLSQNGQPVEGTLALQYVVEYGGAFIYRAYAFFAAFLTVLLMALYVIIFVVRAQAHRIFAVAALGLGCVFMFLIPHRTAPDEYVHITAAYRYTNYILGVGDPDMTAHENWERLPPNLYLRAGDEMLLYVYDYDATDVYAWREMYEGLLARDPGGEYVEVTSRDTLSVFPPLYAVPTLGVLLARLLGLGKVGLLTLGRLANLIFYTVVVSRAIRRMPLAKPMMLVAGLLPMSLQLAASFSYDTFVIALGFYFIAACLDCALAREKAGPRQALLLGALAVLLAPAKAVYLPLLFFVFAIPKGKFANPQRAMLARGGVLAAGFLMWLAFTLPPMLVVDDNIPVAPASEAAAASAEELVVAPSAPEADNADSAEVPTEDESDESEAYDPRAEQKEAVALDPNMPLRPNGDAFHTFGISYILRHIPRTVKLVARSIWEQSPLWLQGLIGGRLGEPIAIDIEVNWVFIIALIGVLLCAALPAPGDEHVLTRRQRLGFGALVLAVAAILVVACLGWTPINYKTLFGMQGRYLLPVLPVLLLALRGRTLRLQKPVWRPLAFAAAALVVLCQLDAFSIIAAR